eukprot:gnl/TRDRNA2_/TRDRNA2_175514_c1_seq1.p1 gnl/TRDRNA2_/TRDRNA2_175514_c1~~gnl/TRDRNA2_/TRDRNA2_175514_c1_seq1.p1  ORF type:complete len:359 (+),score=80.70 gnl/TRDRNA2_/TRDRNA2_175514_c1_seq1:419-1495(+)
MDDGKPAENVGGMPADPALWGITVKQLYDFGAEVFGDHKKIYDAGEDVIFTGLGHYADRNEKTCTQTPHGEWIYNDTKKLPPEAETNMYDVVTNYVKPKTKGTNQSLAVMLNAKRPQKAEWFISHSWAEKFAYFIYVLCFNMFPKHFHEAKFPNTGHMGLMQMLLGLRGVGLAADSVMWICALAINQNADIGGEVGSSVMKSPFAVVLEQAPKMLVLYNGNIDLYTRVWCVLEAFIGRQKKEKDKSFTVQVVGQAPRKTIEDFLEFMGGQHSPHMESMKRELQTNGFDMPAMKPRFSRHAKAFVSKTKVKVQDAKASVEQDRTMIMEHIQSDFTEVNQMIDDMRTELMIKSIPATFQA